MNFNLESTGARTERSRGVPGRCQKCNNAAIRRLKQTLNLHLDPSALGKKHRHYNQHHRNHHHREPRQRHRLRYVLHWRNKHRRRHNRQPRYQINYILCPTNVSLTLVHQPCVTGSQSSKLVRHNRPHNKHQDNTSVCGRFAEGMKDQKNRNSLQIKEPYRKLKTPETHPIKKVRNPKIVKKLTTSRINQSKILFRRHKSLSNLETSDLSDSALISRMSPVGPSFSKSMKMSFSLSSLQPSSGSLQSPEDVKMRTDRPYNSLTKKRKDPEQEQWRRSWGSREENKDDFWAAIQYNYNYIMDTNLIDSCKEANGELASAEGDVLTISWGLKELSGQFSELYAWLGAIQELVYSKEENVLDKSLRAAHTEELRRKAYRRRLFNDQAAKLVARAPTLRDEVAWRVDHLNTKWELVEQIMAPGEQSESDEQDVVADLEHEVKCLRKWLREMETRLQPLSFGVHWSRAELEEKAMEHMVLQRDIEAHGRIVSSVVKLSERVVLSCQQERKQPQTERGKQQHQQISGHALRVASSLERRWHLLFLRALEWQCHIEALAARVCNKSNTISSSGSDSDAGPVPKQRRLSQRTLIIYRRDSKTSVSSTLPHREEDISEDDVHSDTKQTGHGSCFPVTQEPEPVKEESRDLVDGSGSVELAEDHGVEGDVEEESGLSEEEEDTMPPTPVVDLATTSPVEQLRDEADSWPGARPAVSSPMTRTTEEDSPRRRRGTMDKSAYFNTSDRKSKNCATFYFKHSDTESEADCRATQDHSPVVDDSSEEEWTYTSQPRANNRQQITSEEQKNNWIARSHFGENTKTPRVEEERMTGVVSSDVNGNATISNGEYEEDQLAKDSEDEVMNSPERIRRLVSEAEDLVREDVSCERKPVKGIRVFPPLMFNKQASTMPRPRARFAYIKEWLKLNIHLPNEGKPMSQALDSCDASGECTTGESDVDNQSLSSDDLQSSVATYRQVMGTLGCASQSASQEFIIDPERTPVNEKHPLLDSSTPKVVMRTKRKSNGPRPWSVSCISQIGNGAKGLQGTNDPISQFSTSESALHQLVTWTPTKSVSLDASGSATTFNNSSSTLLEETMFNLEGSAAKSSSLRRKKMKLRKKHLGRKSESGSDSLNANHHSFGSDGCSNQPRSPRKFNALRGSRVISKDGDGRSTTLVKSGSFSGSTARQQLTFERSTASDPAPTDRSNSQRRDESTSETEDEPCSSARMPKSAFKGSPRDTILFRTDLSIPQVNIDSDVEKNSLGTNSFSEQAWDNYQENYMSEPYSEAPDSEAARRLTEFGDDYRNYIDSQSDCASSLSACRAVPPPVLRKRKQQDTVDTTEDSDSDIEDLSNLMEKSQSQLAVTEELLSEPSTPMPVNDSIEVESTCRENMRCLRAVLEVAGGALRGERNTKQIRSLIERWELLSSRAEEARKSSILHRDMAAMRHELRTINDRLTSYELVLDQHHLLDDSINQVTSELATLRERKTALLALNVTAHRLVTDAGSAAPTALSILKDEVADLYRVWDETFQKGNQQLNALQALQQFAARLGELQNALRKDKDTLAVLDAALQAGAATEVASSVRDVARLLSEKQDICCQNGGLVKELCIKEEGATVTAMVIANGGRQEGGSLSDSGISDSGSEQELSERERRLAALRRLARTLEAQLAPGSETLVELAKKVEDAETELRGLQKQCRELIVRTAASVEARAANRCRGQTTSTNSKRKKGMTLEVDEVNSELSPVLNGLLSTGDPDKEPRRPRGWVWRVLRAALPFQLALVALFCAACLLEPHCCEASNTLNLSLTPQLRYVRGPPPI